MIVKSYLTGRQQFVENGAMLSEVISVCSGVPQGYIMGPLLFSMYINDLPRVLRASKCVMYADDVQIFCGGKSFNKNIVIESLNADIQNVASWALLNGLMLNSAKTQCVLFCSNNYEHHLSTISPIKVNDATIPYLQHCKNLGVIIDSKMSWDFHVNLICSRIYNSLRTLWTGVSFTTIQVRTMLVKSLILPNIVYCSSLLGRLSAGTYSKLLKAYNACLRFVYGLRRFDSVTHLTVPFLGFPLLSFLDYRSCLLLHKLILSHEPTLLFDRLIFGSSARTGNLRVPRNRTTLRNKSFFVHAVVAYNAIPTNIRNFPFDKFKKELYTHLCNSS